MYHYGDSTTIQYIAATQLEIKVLKYPGASS